MYQIYIRDSTQSDAQFVNDLTRKVMHSYVKRTWHDEESRERYYAVNSFEQSTTQIICEDHQPIGRITLTQNNKAVTVDAIHLVPHVQGRGIGSMIFRRIIENAEKQKNQYLYSYSNLILP